MTCAIYCRLSREDEEKRQWESESIQNQRAILEEYARERGWQVYGLYCDEDYSGADAARPDFCRLLHDAEKGRFQIVLCKTQSRFTRDMELVERYIHGKFPLWGIRFVAVADHADTEEKGNKKARQINGLINQWYLEDLSENIRMVLDFKRQQGQYIAGRALYGYRKDPENKNRLLVDEPAAAVVRQIFRWYLTGVGPGQITQRLNDRGTASPACYKNPETEGGLWNKTAVSRILRNEMYAGVMVQGRRKKVSYKSAYCVDVPAERWFRVPGTHPPIIPPEQFGQVQELLRPRVRSDRRGRMGVLSGLVVCDRCGKNMVRTTNGQGREYLRCGGSISGSCTRHGVRVDRLCGLVGEKLGIGGELNRELAVMTVEKIVVGEVEQGAQTVEIWWKF